MFDRTFTNAQRLSSVEGCVGHLGKGKAAMGLVDLNDDVDVVLNRLGSSGLGANVANRFLEVLKDRTLM